MTWDPSDGVLVLAFIGLVALALLTFLVVAVAA